LCDDAGTYPSLLKLGLVPLEGKEALQGEV
jgi:hypothetical protein